MPANVKRMTKLVLRASAIHENQRLDAVLSEWLPTALGESISKAKVRLLIVAGAVYLNGKRVRIASKSIRAGARIEAYVDLEKLQAGAVSREPAFVLRQDHILFEDEWLIAIDKPPGLPTQPTLDEARVNLFAAVKVFLKTRQGAEAYVGLHHRLDRDTSGVVLFTKRTDANAGVAGLFAQHMAQKTYQALVRGAPLKPEWKVENHLGKIGASGKRARFGAVRAGGDRAQTDFRLIEKFSRAAWVEARPRTGRTHQIRVHLSEAGMPILGDQFYGDSPPSAPRVMLHALRLEFPHPVRKAAVRIESPLPSDFLAAVERMRSKP